MKIPKNSYAFVDGSFNPKTMIYGFGGFLIDQFGKKHCFKGYEDNKDAAKMRNVAGEILGAMYAIKLAKELKMKRLCILHDYEGISAWPLGAWEAKKEGTKKYVTFVKDAILNGLEVWFIKVKAHDGVPGNEEADRLAKSAVGLEVK